MNAQIVLNCHPLKNAQISRATAFDGSKVKASMPMVKTRYKAKFDPFLRKDRKPRAMRFNFRR